MTPPLLQVRDLHTFLGDSHVLRGVNLTLPAGTALGLLGRNGMGKTTLIRTLMGYVPPRQGQVFWQGEDVTAQAPERMARRGIGYVPEGRGIFPNLTVRENLLMAARPGADGRTVWTLERVLATFPRLAERLAYGGQQLSGSEQQMLAIGRALMTHPRLLILDEATEGLAPMIVAEIWRVVALVRETGISTLVVDRNFRAVLAHTDRAVVMEKGRLLRDAGAAELAEDSATLTQLLGV